MKVPPPRLYAIVATEAPVALVFRRGPSQWFHLLRWHLDKGELEPGVWVRKKFFPERCDLSDDGQLMLYYLSGGFDGSYNVFAGLSRVPWLLPLVSWEEGDTWGRGWCFDRPGLTHTWGEPQAIEADGKRLIVRSNAAVSYVNERRRGWTEAPDCPPRDPDDTWDEKRGIILHKPWKGHGQLRLTGGLWTTGGLIIHGTPLYALDLPTGERIEMPGVAWADWDHSGRILAATTDGRLLALDPMHRLAEVETHDLTDFAPDPSPAPDWARDWPARKGR